MRTRQLLLVFIICCVKLSESKLIAQPKALYFGAEKVVVVLNPLTDVPERELPFDRNFFIRKFLPKSDSNFVTAATLFEVKDPKDYDVEARNITIPINLGKIKARTGITLDVKPAVDKIDLNANGFDLFVTEPLKPNRLYDIVVAATPTLLQAKQLTEAFFEMHFRQGGSYQNRVISLIDNINSQKKNDNDGSPIEKVEFQLYYDQHIKPFLPSGAIPAGVDTAKVRIQIVKSLQRPKIIDDCQLFPATGVCVRREAFEQTFVLYNSSTVGFKLDTRAKSILQPDFGVIAYGFGGNGDIGLSKDFMGVMPYIGLNILARPFDPDVRLRQLPKGHIHWHQRLSGHVALTLTSLAKDKYRSNLIGNFNLMLGAGYRVSSSFKLISGMILYRRLNENLLYTDSSVNVVAYAGLSIDIRIRDAIGDVGKLVFSK